MPATPVIAVIDVGKTNKKLFLFDEHYKIVFERSARFLETEDEDGFPCENLGSLRLSVFDSLQQVCDNKEFEIRAVQFSSYGASIVYIDKDGNCIGQLYNYLKPYPKNLSDQFNKKYGGEKKLALATASPPSGSLNSGMQIYRLKYEKPEIFNRVKYALHLPQYLSYLVCGQACSDITSIGCHTGLWDFTKNDYHQWVYEEGIDRVLAPLQSFDSVFPSTIPGQSFKVGIGLHDSSASLIPYLANFQEPFVLISTGTWCISMNPFNDAPLTADELDQDCLCYLHYQGSPVKASRLFAGQEHEDQVKRIADYFQKDPMVYRSINYNAEMVAGLKKEKSFQHNWDSKKLIRESLFATRDLAFFENDEEAYHQLVIDIMERQLASTQLILNNSTIKRIFVDGGFSGNSIYMNLLALAFPGLEVFAASVAQATALGAALAIHKNWNHLSLPNDLIKLRFYSVTQDIIL